MSDESRRDFLKQCLAGAAVLGASGAVKGLAVAEAPASIAKSRVVVARDASLRNADGDVDAQRMLALLDRAMQTLFDAGTPLDPWKHLVHPGETVGVKINVLGGRGISSNRQLVDAICERLQGAGIKAGDIVVWDHYSDELARVGYPNVRGGNRVQCYGTDAEGVGYEEELSAFGSIGSRLSRLLTQRDVMINVPVLKDHSISGVTGAMKNMYGVIHNPNKCHPNGCNPYIADLNMLPEIRRKRRISIMDATTGQYEGGPGFKPDFVWEYNGILVSQDPVALDHTAWQIIEHQRAEKGLKTLTAAGRPPRYIATAADEQHRLGVNDPARIDLRRV
jgi:uncharacterized protein (DUF362 family)